MTKPLLVMFIGIPGSGKTYFAERLAERLGAVRLNSDAMRLAVFGSLDAIEKVYHSPQRETVNSYVFGPMDYVAGQVLKQGISVVYEAIQRTRSDRRGMEALAARCEALPVLVWMQTDHEVAIERGIAREAAPDRRQFDEAKMREVVAHFSDNLEKPEPGENVIEISGEIPFEEQYALFRTVMVQ